jgi:alpha-1,2-mannosyltransferase
MWTRVFAFVAVVFAIVTTVNAVNKGGDAAVFFEGGRRFLNAEPLYAGSSAADGFIGPPFQAVFFSPFAAIAGSSPVAARLLWHALNLASLAFAVVLTARWWNTARQSANLAPRSWLALAGPPLIATLLPLLTNFEHQNLNALLLALLIAAIWQLSAGANVSAGFLIGVATALKAFPALVILYLIARRYWLAAIVAVLSAAVLNLLPLPMYGIGGFAELARTFWRLSTSGWPVRGNNQSLVAVIDRVMSGQDGAGVRVASDAPEAVLVFAVVAVVLLGAMIAILLTWPPSRSGASIEIAAVIVLAVLLSPIAWDHYWTLLFPAFVIVYDGRDERGWASMFWLAAILTSGLSPLTLGASGFNVARHLGTYTIAALVLYVALLLRRRLGGDRSGSKAGRDTRSG